MRHANAQETPMTSVSVRGQTIIPKSLRQACHIREGDLIRWRQQGHVLLVERVVVRPADEDTLSDAEWNALDRLVARQHKHGQVTRYASLQEAKGHSRALRKHAR